MNIEFTKSQDGVYSAWVAGDKDNTLCHGDSLQYAVGAVLIAFSMIYSDSSIKVGPDGSFKKVDAVVKTLAKVAINQLNGPPQTLDIICLRNEFCPEPLRTVIRDFIDGKITKDEAKTRLEAL